MPSLTTTEQLELDGPISPWMAVVVACVLLALFTWSLLRERPILGLRQTCLFWILRAGALGMALWMLLAPTKSLIEVSTTRRAVAILTDVSGSMRTVDPPGAADDLRWAVMQTADSNLSMVRTADAAIAAAIVGERHLQGASTALEQHQRESLVVESTAAAHDAIVRLRTHTAHLVDLMAEADIGRVDPDSAALSRRIARDLEAAEFAAFDDLCVALEKGRTPGDRGWRESLPDLQIRVGSVRRRLSELAKAAQTAETERLQQQRPDLLPELRRQPRLSRVAAFLGSLETGVLHTVGEQADVRFGTFDDVSRALTMQTSGMPGNTSPTEQGNRNTESRLLARTAAADDRSSILRGLQPFLTTAITDSAGDAEVKIPGTNLTSVLEQLDRDRREQPLAAAILLTDASHNAATAVNPRVAAAALQGTPVYVLPIGNTQFVRDILIQSVFAPTVAMRNDEIVIEAVIQAHDCEGETCIIQLLQGEDLLDSRSIPLDSDYVNRRVRFDRLLSEVGQQQFSVRVLPIDRELSELNNQHELEVNVTRSEIRILLSDELPRWEYRYLAQLFRRDPKVELDELLFHPRVIATGRRQESKAFPASADAWDQYDVAILGDLSPEHLTAEAQRSLNTWLTERGGTAIVIAGSEFMPQAYESLPLAAALPVTKLDESRGTDGGSGFAFYVTEAGRIHSGLRIGDTEEETQNAWNFVNQFAPLHDVSPWRLPRPSATTLISAVPKGSLNEEQAAAASSFLCWQAVGRGRVIYLSGPETFRLRFLRGDLLHYRFWGQLLRWSLATDLAAGSELVRIRSDKTRYTDNEPIHVTVRLADRTGNAVETQHELTVIARNSDQEHSVRLVSDDQIPGQYSGTFQSLPPGDYLIAPAGDAISQTLQGTTAAIPSSSLNVRPRLSMELLDTRADRALAQQIADITGGQVIPPTAVEEILALTNLKPEVTQKLETRPLWVEWKYLWIIFGCLHIEWIARKIQGLS